MKVTKETKKRKKNLTLKSCKFETKFRSDIYKGQNVLHLQLEPLKRTN